MSQPDDLSKLLHDIKGKCASIKGAADLFRDCSVEEKREMLALMSEAARNISVTLQELGKTLK